MNLHPQDNNAAQAHVERAAKLQLIRDAFGQPRVISSANGTLRRGDHSAGVAKQPRTGRTFAPRPWPALFPTWARRHPSDLGNCGSFASCQNGAS